MYQVTKTISFCYGHRLLDYEGKCRHLHGHNGRAEITLRSQGLDRRGMVADFSDVKRVVGGWIDRELDHNMLLNERDPLVPLLQKKKERVYLMADNPTAENIAKLIFKYALARGLPVASVKIWETETSSAVYSS